MPQFHLPNGSYHSNLILKPLRDLAHATVQNTTELFSMFFESLEGIFDFSDTFCYVLNYDYESAGYHIEFERLPTVDGMADSEQCKSLREYVVSFSAGLERDMLLQVFKECKPGKTEYTPKALIAAFLTYDPHITTLCLVLTNNPQKNELFHGDNPGFLLTACGYLSNGLQHEFYKSQLNTLLYNDYLTDTPNRAFFYHILVEAMQFADFSNSMIGVVMLDVANMKQINDAFGYSVGDQVIKELSSRIKHAYGGQCPISRFGGDDFALFAPNMRDRSEMRILCDELVQTLKQPIALENTSILASVNMGISVYPTDGDSADTLLKNAEAAMYKAKYDLDENYKFYTADITELSGKLLFLNTELQNAIVNDEFELYYQAQLEVSTGKIHSVEGLIRWNHPTRGVLPPSEFIPFAEENGLIIAIDCIVIRKACMQAKKWYDEGMPIMIGINISAEHFRKDDLVVSLSEIISEVGSPPEMLEIEILESIMLENMEHAIDVINQIKAMGLIVSLDDFGAGYSSLEYITLLPLDILKIDRGFTMNLEENPRNKIIVKTILTLAKEMNFKVVAEGVEMQSHLDYLRIQGCDYAQGYFINRPMPVKDVEAIIKTYNSAQK